MLKSSFVDSEGSISPKGGAGTNGGVLNSQGDEGVIGQVSFHPVPKFDTPVDGAFRDFMSPPSIGSEPASGSARPASPIMSAFDAPFGK